MPAATMIFRRCDLSCSPVNNNSNHQKCLGVVEAAHMHGRQASATPYAVALGLGSDTDLRYGPITRSFFMFQGQDRTMDRSTTALAIVGPSNEDTEFEAVSDPRARHPAGLRAASQWLADQISDDIVSPYPR